MCRLLWQCLVVSLFFMFLHCDVCSSSSSPSKPAPCSPDQSFALLHFKNSFSIINIYMCKARRHCCDGGFHHRKTENWKEGSDCCSWDGVTCDRLTGYVVGLDVGCSGLVGTLYPNNTLFHLHHLRKLNLSRNDFVGSEISSMFGHFTKLTHLDLSASYFSGSVPPEIFYLSNLVSLDVSHNVIDLDQHSFDRLSRNLTNLRVLVLDSSNLSSIAPCSLVNLSSSIISLHLSSTGLQGEFPNDVLRFPFLQQLDLSDNGPFIGHLPKSNWSSPVRLLDLDSCGFEESIPEALFNLTRLTYLNLGNNNFSGQLPSSIFNLTQLSYMDLSANQLEGHFPSQVSGLQHLYKLDLSNNLLSGKIPSWLLSLPSLQCLYLTNNKLTGPIEIEQPGPVDSMFELVNLVSLDLSSNNLSGIVNIDLFSKLISLISVDFSYNRNLSLRSHSSFNFSLPNLTSFQFSSCNLTEFPIFLRNFKNLITLDLSDNKIIGQISQEELGLWQDLRDLNLSHNSLTRVVQIPLMKLDVLDLHSNSLQGPLAVPPHGTNMTFFSVSHNNLTGEIPSTICNMNSLKYLVLANNNFSGLIPECLRNYEELEVLDLSMNNFHGSIPQIFPNDSSLKTINLNDNQLEGPLPTSLANCSGLEVLDVGNNMVNDTFPLWLATLPNLQVLILRSNRFLGCIGNSKTRFHFVKLRILDIAHNQLTGILPTKLFKSFKTMMHGQDNNTWANYMGSMYYQDHVVLTLKGVSRKYERILTILSTIDLSSNRFQGSIPEVVGELKSLKIFNLSHNLLTGQIPSSLRKLTELESLDLSSNKLAKEFQYS